MKEYRIKAYFSSVYPDRTYKRKIFNTLEEALKVLPEAEEYYSSRPYADKLIKVVIQSRKVEFWEDVKDQKEREMTLRELAEYYINKGIEAVIEVEWWWSSYKYWDQFFIDPEVNIIEDYGNKMEMDPEYSYKGTAADFLEYTEGLECVSDIEGRYCEEFKINVYPQTKHSKGGVVVFAKYVQEAYN